MRILEAVGEEINGMNSDIAQMNKDFERVGIDVSVDRDYGATFNQANGKGYTNEDKVIDELFGRHFSKNPELTRLLFGQHFGLSIREVHRMDSSYTYWLLHGFPCTPDPEKRAIESLLKEGE